MTADEAYRVCQSLARAHYENFPVASWLLPRAMRPHVAAIYAFARTADDFADEGDVDAATRLARLAAWRELLHGRVSTSTLRDPALADVATPIFTALHDTLTRCDLNVQLCDDLITAFEQDVVVHRYGTWDEVLEYCRHSANPVGRLVLGLAGRRDPETMAQSDAVCTALQLTNFWQDFGRDWSAGRLYVPAEVLQAHRADEPSEANGPVPPEWRAVFSDVIGRTATLFSLGRPVCDAVRGRLRYELRATWLGGTTVLERTAALRQVSFESRPVLERRDGLRIARDALLWRRDD